MSDLNINKPKLAYLQSLSGCHGLSWPVMDDFHGWLSWMTFLDDFHGFYILIMDRQTERQTLLLRLKMCNSLLLFEWRLQYFFKQNFSDITKQTKSNYALIMQHHYIVTNNYKFQNYTNRLNLFNPYNAVIDFDKTMSFLTFSKTIKTCFE